MKAVEWVGKFQNVEVAEILAEYGKETADLVAVRTKTSKPETKLSAMEGAIKEQYNKFRSICQKVPALTENMFGDLVNAMIPEYNQLKQQSQKTASQDDVKEYRKNRKRRI